MPDNPLKEAIMGLWNYDTVPKPNVKVIQVQMTLPILTDGSQSPYWVLRPLSDLISEVVWHLLFRMEEGSLGVPLGMPMSAEDCMLFRCVVGGQGGQGGANRIHKPRVHGLALVIPLQWMNGMDGGHLAQWARQPSSDGKKVLTL